MRAVALAGLAAAAQAQIRCPGSAAQPHAQCTVLATASATCADVKEEVAARADGSQNGTWTDPHNGGTYKTLNTRDNGYDLQRVTGCAPPPLPTHPGPYTDLISFSFSDDTNGTCVISACSQSQVQSVSDMSTNYCNMRNLYCGSADGCTPVVHDFVTNETAITPSDSQGTPYPGAGTNKSMCITAACPKPTPAPPAPATPVPAPAPTTPAPAPALDYRFHCNANRALCIIAATGHSGAGECVVACSGSPSPRTYTYTCNKDLHQCVLAEDGDYPTPEACLSDVHCSY